MATANYRPYPKPDELPDPDIPSTSYSSSSSSILNSNRKRWWTWTNLLPILVGLVVIGEMVFLSRLDMFKHADLIDSWGDSFYHFTERDRALGAGRVRVMDSVERCEAWLKEVDSVPYSRDFRNNPILVKGNDRDGTNCSVGCKFSREPGKKKPDAAFSIPKKARSNMTIILRSMESPAYYSDISVANARRRGYNVVMTTSLSSDVPVGYFSWAEYDIMAPLLPKTETALAAAFISNCGARNFRNAALIGLQKANVKVDSYGLCHQNRDVNVDKVKALKRYKFSLAFENSNEEDYVTEKFFQSLVAGAVPVVVGAPNILDFAPYPNSVLHIKRVTDIKSIARRMKYLAKNSTAYNESLRWKFEGPTDSFKALLDMSAVHSSCRLCIHLATKVQEKDEQSPKFKKRPCKCMSSSKTTYHVYVRERGRLHMESIFLRSDNMTLTAVSSAVVSKFTSLKHVPVWKSERPEMIRGGNDLKVHRIYPVGMTQRQALYAFRFKDDDELRYHLETHPCAKFEVIFV